MADESNRDLSTPPLASPPVPSNPQLCQEHPPYRATEVSKARTEHSNRRWSCPEKDGRQLFRDKLNWDGSALSAIPSQTRGRGGLTKQCSET